MSGSALAFASDIAIAVPSVDVFEVAGNIVKGTNGLMQMYSGAKNV